jgi:ABC-type antimicrobial peptide transport system permease subunit
MDRDAVARRLLADPLGWGVLVALAVAVLSATALAALGLVVATRATSLRSSGELAVLHVLGTPTRTLGGALVVEQSVLAGLGVLCGVLVGLAVAAAMAPSIVLTERGGRPVPEVLVVVPPWLVTGPAIALFGLALVLAAAIARRARRDVAVGLLRMGADQ